jgi:hypothetical protein
MVRKKLIVAIESAEAFVDRQSLCRDGWVKMFGGRHPDVDIFFVVGNGWSSSYRDDQDVVHVPAVDLYEWLPQKTQQLFKYVLRNYDFDFLFKCDDDTFVHLDRLVGMLGDGHDFVGAINTWFAGDKSYYAEGGAGYLLSRKAVALAYDNLSSDKLQGPEDVYVSLALRDAGVQLIPTSRFNQFELVVPTANNAQVTCHYIKTKKQVDDIIDGLVRDAETL